MQESKAVNNEDSHHNHPNEASKDNGEEPQGDGKVRKVNTPDPTQRRQQNGSLIPPPTLSSLASWINESNKNQSIDGVKQDLARYVTVSQKVDRRKPKDRKLTARKARRLRNEEKLRAIEAEKTAAAGPTALKADTAGPTSGRKRKAVKTSAEKEEKSQFTSTVEANALNISPLGRMGPPVPQLSHDLSRVLFNPGIYQLQDPRSRVYNFDPYLEKIMPVSEFDFKILKEYITSSRDEALQSLALQHGKKYVGSSSSMTSTLSQFHFLLSRWRDLNTASLSRGFSDPLKSFTIISRSPASVFLRYREGVYAMDSDKEYDTGNILMSLGKSMEKLLTQKPQDFERYRKGSEIQIPAEERNAPEAYQYTHSGDMLMRAQLDACDDRLPGTGTFDLKTRAVASVRHNIKQVEEGFGYQIRTRFGDWESYEREYFDMMRSSFLKYSLQVRLGQMDGIFVAFHNVERIFGFQYISLPEMDMAIHGQYDTTLGDQEFRLSVELLNQVLNLVTERFPKRSLRLQFETRDLPAGGVFMQIFAEPMDEASIEAIQNSRKEAIDAFEQRLITPDPSPDPEYTSDPGAGTNEQDKVSSLTEPAPSTSTSSAEPKEPAAEVVESSTNEQPTPDVPKAEQAEQSTSNGQASSNQAEGASNTAKTSKAVSESDTPGELLVLKLRIQNKVNGAVVTRPAHLRSSDNWSLDYSLEEETRANLAQAQYRASKARRKAALEEREESTAASYYVQKLREMAVKGAEWRKAQDELDAGRERVVLYEPKP